MKIERLVLIVASAFLLTGCFSTPSGGNDDYCPIDATHYAYDENEHWLELNEGADCLIPYGYNGAHEFTEKVIVEGDDTHDREVDFTCNACGYTKHVSYPSVGNQLLEHMSFRLADDGTYYIIENIEYFDVQFDHIYFPTTYQNLPVRGIESLDRLLLSTDCKIIIPDGYTYLGEGFLNDVIGGVFVFIPSSVTEIKKGALSHFQDMIYTDYKEEDGTAVFSGTNELIDKVIYDVTSDYEPTIKDNIQYVLDETNHTASIVNMFESSRYNGSSKPAVIPNTVNFNGEYRVTRVNDGACISKYIDSSVFSNSNLNYIGKKAFYDCAFNNGVNIPETFTTISDSAFYDATIRDLTLNEGLTRIEAYAFCNADINEVILPSTIEYIGMFAFGGCDFEEITLPQALKKLGRGAFAGVKKAYFNCLSVTLFDEATDGDPSSSPFDNIREIVIGDGVTIVPAELCYKCWLMEKVSFSETVEVIGAGAFMGTRRGNPSTDSAIVGQGRLVLPSSLREIGANAFRESPFTSTRLALPKTLHTIGAYAFYEAEFITEFSYDDTILNFQINVACGKNWNVYADWWGDHNIPVQCRDGATS